MQAIRRPWRYLSGLLLAIAIGVINGFLISVVEMPPLLTTLASSLAALGITRSTLVPHYVVYLAKGHDAFLQLGGNICRWRFLLPLVVFAVAAIFVHLFLSRTVRGAVHLCSRR